MGDIKKRSGKDRRTTKEERRSGTDTRSEKEKQAIGERRSQVEGSLKGLDLKEFFLLLSSTGLAYRRCQLVRVDGDQIGVSFLARDTFAKKKAAKKRATA
jgi:hypothetical protein